MCPRRKCPSRAAHSSHEIYEPRRGSMRAHEEALKKLRLRFGRTWHECGKKKKNAKANHQDEPIEQQWHRMVVHAAFKRFHHLCSQLLKEIKEIKRRLD